MYSYPHWNYFCVYVWWSYQFRCAQTRAMQGRQLKPVRIFLSAHITYMAKKSKKAKKAAKKVAKKAPKKAKKAKKAKRAEGKLFFGLGTRFYGLYKLSSTPAFICGVLLSYRSGNVRFAFFSSLAYYRESSCSIKIKVILLCLAHRDAHCCSPSPRLGGQQRHASYYQSNKFFPHAYSARIYT